MPAELGANELDRAVGLVVASAAGDALGKAYLYGPGLDDRQEPAFGESRFGHDRWEWIDATSTSIPILEALASGASLSDTEVMNGIVARWLEWAGAVKFVDNHIRSVFFRLWIDASEDSARAAAKAVHDREMFSASNGSLMRTGPVALGYLADGTERALVEAASRISQLTHFDQKNTDAVVLWSLAIRHAVRTGKFEPRIGLEWLEADRRDQWAGTIDEATQPGSHPRDFEYGNGGTVQSFRAALSAITGATNLRDALNRAARSGGDTPTVAAITGSLAGAIWGASQVPPAWQQQLHGWPGYRTSDLTRLAVLAARSGRPDSFG